jgi:hypothetical protein
MRPVSSSSLTGIRMERRRYFSDARLREELMRLYHVGFTLFVRFSRTGSVSNDVGLPRPLSQTERYVRCASER